MNNIIINTPKGKRVIGSGEPVFIIAEMSCNHGQSFKRALKIIDAAAEAGVDAIKLQTFKPDVITIDSEKSYFQIKVNKAWKGQTLYNLYKKVYTPWEWHPKLKKYAEKKGLLLFSTPSNEDAVDFLQDLGVELYKVGSFEIVDHGLLKRIGQTKKPVIISRGMASLKEIKMAIETLKRNGSPQVAVLQCISAYPANYEEMNLATIPDLSKRFKIISGLSDHTIDGLVSLVAVSLGASIIEKHFILKRSDGGPDAAFSLEPKEMKTLVQTTRKIEQIIGKPNYRLNKRESENKIFRRSLFVVENIKKGEKFTKNNIRSIRPGHGLETKFFEKIIGKRANKDIEKGTPLSWELIDNNLK